MKYIDADRLRAEIEIKKKTEGWCEVGKDTADIYYARGVRFTCDFVLNLIDSLQQEQPDKDKKTFDDYLKASPSERRKMNMTEILGEEKLAETKKQMEQPEVNFEKELEEEIERFYRTDEYRIADTLGRGFETLARHFAEWQYQKDRVEFAKLKAREWINGYDEGYAKGLDARKEDK